LSVSVSIAIGDVLIMKGGGVGIPLTGLTPPHFCACPKLQVARSFFSFSDLRRVVVVCFVDVGRIGDHYCLKLSFQHYKDFNSAL
jgi:hypothetical protein